jgi:hypothetical protein
LQNYSAPLISDGVLGRRDTLQEVPSIIDIDKLGVLFGPVPLNKYPNTKGKGNWHIVGKSNKLSKAVPVFKDTNHIIALHNSVDWSIVKGWRKRLNFHEGGGYCDYETVRELEMLILYDMRNVEIRATMQFLLLNKKKVADYYDLTIDNFRRIYIQMVNTSFDKKKAAILLKGI